MMHGGSITVSWDDSSIDREIIGVNVFRKSPNMNEFEKVAEMGPEEKVLIDTTVKNNQEYFYKIVINARNGIFIYESNQPAIAVGNWFDFDMKYFLMIVLILSGAIIYYTETAKRGKKHFIRKNCRH